MTDWLHWVLVYLIWGPLLFLSLGIILSLTLPYELGNVAAAITGLALLIYYVDLIKVN